MNGVSNFFNTCICNGTFSSRINISAIKIGHWNILTLLTFFSVTKSKISVVFISKLFKFTVNRVIHKIKISSKYSSVEKLFTLLQGKMWPSIRKNIVFVNTLFNILLNNFTIHWCYSNIIILFHLIYFHSARTNVNYARDYLIISNFRIQISVTFSVCMRLTV